MKTIAILSAIIFTLSLSSCFIVEVQPAKRKGPPAWAPAHGYRRHHVTIYKAPAVVIKKGGHHHH